MKPNIMVFDVESTSLHGTGFAIGALVVDRDGVVLEMFELLSKQGAANASVWVKDNVMPHLGEMPTCDTDRELRDAFYAFYMRHKDSADIWGDCVFPVETNFLSEVVKDDLEERQWNMPYPLKDVSTIINVNVERAEACGIKGLRKHNPLDDAKASLYCLRKALAGELQSH